jgi:hypothetical protein
VDCRINTVGEDYNDRAVDALMAELAGVSAAEWAERTLRRNVTIGGNLSRGAQQVVAPMREQLVGQTVVFLGNRIGAMFACDRFLEYMVEGEDWVCLPTRYESEASRLVVSTFLRDLLHEQTNSGDWVRRVHRAAHGASDPGAGASGPDRGAGRQLDLL